METRLKLARTLLSDIGVIFISIDEYEFANLKLLCDQVFGANHFIENFIWVKNATKNNSTTTGTIHEYILCYAKNAKNLKGLIRAPREGIQEVTDYANILLKEGYSFLDISKKLNVFYKQNPQFKGIEVFNKIDEKGIYRTVDISAPSKGPRESFDIYHPITKLPCKKSSRVWAFKKETIDEMILNNEIEFGEDHTTIPRVKRYLDKLDTMVLSSVLQIPADGKRDLDKLKLGSTFTYPKPVILLKTLFQAFPNHKIIVDFFGGSGTTMQAVIELNAEQQSDRKCILITNNENNIFEEITCPRISKISSSYRANVKVSSVDYVPCDELASYDFSPEIVFSTLNHTLKLKHPMNGKVSHHESEEASVVVSDTSIIFIAKSQFKDKQIITQLQQLRDAHPLAQIHAYVLDDEEESVIHETFWRDPLIALYTIPSSVLAVFNKLKKELTV